MTGFTGRPSAGDGGGTDSTGRSDDRPVRELMKRPSTVVPGDATVAEAIRLLTAARVAGAPVVSGEHEVEMRPTVAAAPSADVAVATPRGGSADGGGALWRRWVLANAVAETVGLGAAALVAMRVAGGLDGPSTSARVWAALAVLATGGFEGMVVGVAQWRVLRTRLRRLTARSWLVATCTGALIAWVLGLVPSLLLGGEAGAGGPPPAPPSGAVQLILAAGMGLVLGPILGVPQWLALRGHVRRAGWWVPANSAAWAVGMPVVFAAAGSVPPGLAPDVLAAVVLTVLFAAGAAVGAVHGAVLVRLVRGSGR